MSNVKSFHSCPYYDKSKCKLSSSLAGCPVPIVETACVDCESHHPIYHNKVTYGRAIVTLRKKGLPYDHLVKTIAPPTRKPIAIPTKGPGTELRKIIEWFVWNESKGDCNTCKNREQKMNLWGPRVCLERIDTIKRWLKHSAYIKGIPYSDRVATAAIRTACRNASK